MMTTKKACEITGMQLIWEDEYILMICCDSQAYYVYDEENTECSEELRRVTGGHRDEISIITYNDHFSLVASGSLDGDVILWDFEMSKIEAILQGHTSDITGI
jgi:WD40 repeat protein